MPPTITMVDSKAAAATEPPRPTIASILSKKTDDDRQMPLEVIIFLRDMFNEDFVEHAT